MALFEKEYDEVLYSAQSEAGWEQLVSDIQNNVNGMGDSHQRIKAGKQQGLSISEIRQRENKRE